MEEKMMLGRECMEERRERKWKNISIIYTLNKERGKKERRNLFLSICS